MRGRRQVEAKLVHWFAAPTVPMSIRTGPGRQRDRDRVPSPLQTRAAVEVDLEHQPGRRVHLHDISSSVPYWYGRVDRLDERLAESGRRRRAQERDGYRAPSQTRPGLAEGRRAGGGGQRTKTENNSAWLSPR